MKRVTFVFAVLAILFSTILSSYSQTFFGLKLGAEQVGANYQNIYFEYIDESPSQDHIVEDFSISESYFPVTISPYFTLETKAVELELEFKLGLESEFRTLGTYIGITKNFGDTEKGAFGIGTQLGLGRSKVSLGDIYQNDLFIQINGNKYYEKSLAVNYYEQQLTVKPYIRYKKLLGAKFPLTILAGYQYPFMSLNGKVIFKGEDPNQEGGQFKEVVSLNRRNIALYSDGMQRKKGVFSQQGVFFNVGIGFPLN